MRKFTKTHNDINWLFPSVNNDSEKIFDDYEQLATDLLKSSYGNKETFTVDDMIDAFMKGASIACGRSHNLLVNLNSQLKEARQLYFKQSELYNKMTKHMLDLVEQNADSLYGKL